MMTEPILTSRPLSPNSMHFCCIRPQSRKMIRVRLCKVPHTCKSHPLLSNHTLVPIQLSLLFSISVLTATTILDPPRNIPESFLWLLFCIQKPYYHYSQTMDMFLYFLLGEISLRGQNKGPNRNLPLGTNKKVKTKMKII